MTVLLEPFPPWLRDVNRFSSSETQVPSDDSSRAVASQASALRDEM